MCVCMQTERVTCVCVWVCVWVCVRACVCVCRRRDEANKALKELDNMANTINNHRNKQV